MSSIRNAIFAAAVAAMGVSGCQRPYYDGAKAELNPTPIQEDEAMQIRQWSVAKATYPNGDVPAGPTSIFRAPRRGMEDWKYYYADTGAFFLDVLALPYTLYKTPQSQTVIYPGETLEPTYTAVPPVPEELQQPAPVAVVEATTEPATVPTTQPATQP